jgi:outer membrane protein OmpA-like peptidoglycan-associated protein
VIHKLSSGLGESAGNTRKALEAMIPTILAGAASEASTPSGAARLFEMAKEAVGTDMIGNLAHHLGGTAMEHMERSGQDILSTLFGDKVEALVNWLVRFAGIKSASASSLMAVVSSLVMNLLGKQITQHGLSASGLGSLLAGQSGWLSKLLPAKVAEIPGFSALVDYAGQAGAAVHGAARQGEEAVRGAAHEVGRAGDRLVEGARPWASALVPLCVLGLAVAALPFMMRGCGTGGPAVVKAPDIRGPEARVPEVRTPDVKDAGIRGASYDTDLAKLAKIKLPNGVNLEFPEGSFLNDVYKYLVDTAGVKSRSFVFEKLNFDGPAIKMAPETETYVKALSTLVKAFPGVQLRIEGHTDDAGDAAENRRLSLERANAVKELLVKAGLPADRITTEGFGSEKPMAPNDTPENRAKNRRIEFTLVKT